MPTGFAILAHDDPQLLGRLARRLEGSPLVVHLDARVDVDEYESVARITAIAGARYSSRRVAVNWGGFSVVDAMLAAGGDVSDDLSRDDHLVFLSGRCYPLRSVSSFYSHLKDSPFRVHARAYDLEEAGGWHRARYARRHGFDGMSSRLGHRDSTLRRIARRTSYYARAVHPNVATGLRPAAGSQWIAVPNELYREAVDAFDDRDFAFLRDGYAPDEMAFHTYIYNSRWVGETEFATAEPLEPPGKTSQFRNFHLLDEAMSGEIEKQSVLAPDARSSFARKFDSIRDSEALDLLDRKAGVE